MKNRLSAALVAAALGSAVLAGLNSGTALAKAGYSVTTNQPVAFLLAGPSLNAATLKTFPNGRAIEDIICSTPGDKAGVSPYPSNATWDFMQIVHTDGTRWRGYMTDMRTTTEANGGRTNLANGGYWLRTVGIPDCTPALTTGLGQVVAPTPPPPAGTADTLIWVGSPVTGRWSDGSAGSNTYGLPTNPQHLLNYWGRGQTSDWVVDIPGRQGINLAGAQVKLFAAPNDPALNSQITARVLWKGGGCYGGYEAGTAVRIGLFHGSAFVGDVTFNHLVNVTYNVNDVVPRWGTVIGTVGSFNSGSCWDGAHVHIEMYSDALNAFSCYNRTWAPGQNVDETNFIGFVGRTPANGVRQGCP